MNPVLVTLPENGRFGAAMKRILPAPMLSVLLARLETVEWHEARREFYRQREENLTSHPAFADVFDLAARCRIAADVGSFFDAEIDPQFDVAAHKMIRGDYIAPHTDENDGGECYRLTVTLNEGWRADEGGILLVLRDSDVRSVRDAWLPTQNNGLLFRIGPDSYHAVTPVTSDRARLSLVFTFKDGLRGDKAALPSTEPWYPFPWEPDLKDAAETAVAEGIARATFDGSYRMARFASARELRAALGVLENAPRTLSYTTDRGARNVDAGGEQPKGTDTVRMRVMEEYARLPPIAIVRRRCGGHILVNGSHRLSYAVDNGWPIVAAVFEEAAEPAG